MALPWSTYILSPLGIDYIRYSLLLAFSFFPCLFGNFNFDKLISNTRLFFRCVFVDAGVAAIDIETRKRKEEMKMKEAQARAVAEHGDLALIAVDGLQSATQERIPLRPPMLQV